jgi:hypothetical protein
MMLKLALRKPMRSTKLLESEVDLETRPLSWRGWACGKKEGDCKGGTGMTEALILHYN